MEEMTKNVCTLVIIEYYGIIFIKWGGGSMFMGSKNFSGSWIHNFIANELKIILRNIKNACCTFIYICGDLYLWARTTHESHQNWSPTNNDGSTVLHVSVIY